MNTVSGGPTTGRRAEAGALLFMAVAAVGHVVASSGGPSGLRTAGLVLTAAAAAVAAFAGGARWIDRWRLALVLLFLTQVAEVRTFLHRPDGFEYYSIVRSLLFDQDLELANDYSCLKSFGQYSGGRSVSRVPMGVGLLWSPAIVVTHAGTLVARLLGSELPADGCSIPYTSAVTLASFLFAMTAIFLSEAAVRRFQGPAIALLVAFGLWAATPLVYYAVWAPSSSHPSSAFAAAVFLTLWLRNRDKDDLRSWLVMGAAGGLMSVVRIQDAVLLAVPVVDLLLSRRPGFLRKAIALGGPVAFAFLVQAFVWAGIWGPEFLKHIRQRNAFVAEFHVMEVLFSSRHGLFVWTPLWLVGALGWFRLARREARLGLAVWTGFLLLLLVNSGFWDWWSNIAFGQRRFLGLTLLFGLGVGQVLEVLERRPLLPLAAGVFALALWNQQFTEIFVGRMVAKRSEPQTLDRLAPAQVEVFLRSWLASEEVLPRWLFVAGYDNLKGVWLDWGRSLEGHVDLTMADEQQPLPQIIGEGWLDPSERDGVAFRRSRGFYSTLRVPVYDPTDFRLRVRGRSFLPDREVGVTLSVNGSAVGQARATRDFGEMRYVIPRRTLRRGFNTLLFTYDTTRRDVDPSGGLNSAVAFQTLDFESAPRESAFQGPEAGRPPASLAPAR